ncbi:hypothetical protein SAMN05216262_10839 [Colwellia chukchiensis]|uniref:Uncharacterized protein n=1 Tax=Colwellia chukchiensis TaxID=641665 RepID=A0A1H7NNV8_9GAMM|nr:hypothetical protein [Colwellia chukchiensis]SEL25091.1 hypothetical protein SAMN05216262_10839 [Colwellia chukchiensis]
MTLFSWFNNSTRVNSPKNTKASLEQELSTFNNNTMWPIAKVRGNISRQQQAYLKVTAHIKQEAKLKVLKEQVSKV